MFWKHLDRAPLPFGELAWDHARRSLGKDAAEEQIADAVTALLRRANAGPGEQEKPKMSKRDRRVAARTKATPPHGEHGRPAAGAAGLAVRGKNRVQVGSLPCLRIGVDQRDRPVTCSPSVRPRA